MTTSAPAPSSISKRPARTASSHSTVFMTPPNAKKCGRSMRRPGAPSSRRTSAGNISSIGLHEGAQAPEGGGIRKQRTERGADPAHHRKLRQRLQRGGSRDAGVQRERNAARRQLGVPGGERRRVEAELAHDVHAGAGLFRVGLLARERIPDRVRGDIRVAFRVARDADRGDSCRGERTRLEDLERARVLARGRRLVAGDEQRARDAAVLQPRERRSPAPRARRCAARRGAGSREIPRARRRRRPPRRPRPSYSAYARRTGWSRTAIVRRASPAMRRRPR